MVTKQAMKTRWANIICHENKEPYLLIVTDGEWSSELPVSNSNILTVERVARDVYGVAKKRIFVTQILDGKGK